MSNAHLVLWGHSLNDYREMFDLSEQELSKPILDVAPGPSSFNVEMQQQGKFVVSCDELFKLDKTELEQQSETVSKNMLEQVHQHEEQFIWDKIDSVETLAKQRRAGMEKFLADYESGKSEGRYRSENFTALPFSDFEFDIALCSHYLFGHRGDQDEAYHVAMIKEACRAAREIRIFPLLDSAGEVSALVGPVMLQLQQNNYGVEVRGVPYQFQKNGNAMLRVWLQECEVK